jgi:pyrroline-5-carboxylate reductase
MTELEKVVGFIGGGMMAEALCRGLLHEGVCQPEQIRISEPNDERRTHFARHIGEERVYWGNVRIVEEADVIVLAVKPQMAEPVLQPLAGLISPEKLVVSIITGLTLEVLAATLGTRRIVRVMPNTPVLVASGAAAFAADTAVSETDRDVVNTILGSVGTCFELPERLLDAVTGLSGSGPAFVYIMIDAMADAGVYLGLPRTVAEKLAAQTFLGAAKMVIKTGEHPARLKDRVATPGGTTVEGIAALERAGLRNAVFSAVVAAAEKAARLSNRE